MVTLKRVRLAVVALVAAAALALPAWTPAQATASCFTDGAGAATHGGLSDNAMVILILDDINESSWDGNLAYNAKRFYSNGSESYSVYVSYGPHTYGTSGNTTRRSGIQRAGYSTMTSWRVTQYKIC